MSYTNDPSHPLYSPNGAPPLVPKRRAPPPPTNFVPPGQNSSVQPPASSHPQPGGSYPSVQPQRPTTTSQPYVQQQRPPPVNRPGPQQTTPQNQGGIIDTVSKYIWGEKDKPVPQVNPRQELMQGATTQKFQIPDANSQHWNQLQSNKDAEADYYQQLANQVDTKSMDFALQRAQESEELGMASLTELVRQGDSLNRVERDVETIHLQLDRGDRQIRSISGISGAVANVFTPDRAKKQQQRVYDAHHNTEARTVQVQQFGQQSIPTNGAPPPRPSEAVKPAAQSVRDKLAEQDRQLEQLSASLGNLHNIAGTINVELASQNEQLDRVTRRTDQAIARTHESNYKMGRLM